MDGYDSELSIVCGADVPGYKPEPTEEQMEFFEWLCKQVPRCEARADGERG